MADPVTSRVEMIFALEDAKLIVEARRQNAATEIAAAASLAITGTQMAEFQAMPSAVSTVEL